MSLKSIRFFLVHFVSNKKNSAQVVVRFEPLGRTEQPLVLSTGYDPALVFPLKENLPIKPVRKLK